MTSVEDLVARSNRLGADPRNTNYAGGNTSAKGSAVDPVTMIEVSAIGPARGPVDAIKQVALQKLRRAIAGDR